MSEIQEIYEVAKLHAAISDAIANGAHIEAVIEGAIKALRDKNAALPCRENALALTKLEEALHWLKARQDDRAARGVAGTEKP